MKYLFRLVAIAMTGLVASVAHAGSVKPGDLISPDNASAVADLVSPGNFALVKQGMRMKIVPTERLEWPPPYKAATEKYASQVILNNKGELENYVAGLPFPAIDPNDPQVATKVMWNFSYRPESTDDADIHEVEMESNSATSTATIEHFVLGHVSYYYNTGRTEVQPIPTDPEGVAPGIRYRFRAFPFEEPFEIRGTGIVRYRYIDPSKEDNTWAYNPAGRHVRRLAANILSDVLPPCSKMGGGGGGAGGHAGGASGCTGATFVNNIDPDSMFGFAAKVEDFNYRLLGSKPMLASVHAGSVPAKPCQFDNNRSVCPENWEMRSLYVIEANAKPQSWHQLIGSDGVLIRKRILYVDSEGWFITASDQYDRDGTLWKTIATFSTYRDRPVPDAQVAIFPFKRIFQTAMIDEDLQSGYSTVVYTPGHESQDRECWYINMGAITKQALDPNRMPLLGDR
jgi:hypothetical protein